MTTATSAAAIQQRFFQVADMGTAPLALAQVAQQSMESSGGAEPEWFVALVLGAVLTALAGVVGKRYEASKSKQAWLRDQKLRCTSALLGDVHVAGKALWDLASVNVAVAAGPPTTQSAETASREVNAAVAMANSRAAEVELLLGEKTRVAAKALVESLDNASQVFHDREWLGDRNLNELVSAFDEHGASKALNGAIDAFVAAARAEVVGRR